MESSKKRVEEFIRVDHAGERGAVKIYEGQLLALNTLVKNESLKKTIEEFLVFLFGRFDNHEFKGVSSTIVIRKACA